MKKIIISIIVLLFVSFAAIYFFRSDIKDIWNETKKEPVPTAITFDEATQDNVINTNATNKNINSDIEINSEDTTLPTSNNIEDDIEIIKKDDSTNESILDTPTEIASTINLDIPFTSQAPRANWGLPYQEACEEASMLMSARYLQGRTIEGPDDADAAILQLVSYANNDLGYPIDSTAEQSADVIEKFYELETEVIYDFSWDDVKKSLSLGYPVIVPAAGRQLGNPNFTEPGPLYHMLVIKGYTEDIVITNDPGTRNGANYQYSYDKLYNAVHDWNNGDVNNGQKVMIIVYPKNKN
ncbi:MAG: C39 family peptidase [bacterium]|nr:C39 family peptidase [bacterium]